MNKMELVKHFEEKYKDNVLLLNIIKEKTEDQLREVYERKLIRRKNENEILENGSATYTIDFDTKLNKEVEKFMYDNDMFTMFDGKIQYRCGNDGRLLGVPAKFVEELEEKYEIRKSRQMYILGRKDIQNLKTGNKVIVTTSGFFGLSSEQGMVHEVKEDQVIIRKYRSKAKGFVLNVGNECILEKIEAFSKVS